MLVRKCGLGGTLRMAWVIVDTHSIYYEGQWLHQRDRCDSYGNTIHYYKWIPKEIGEYLDYILAGTK